MAAKSDDNDERVLEEFRDPITGELILRRVQLPDGVVAVDLMTADAIAIGRHLYPKTTVLKRKDGKVGERRLYKIAK